MRYAKIEPFMDIYIDPEFFRFNDKSNRQNRYITMKEVAFVGSRITTSALNNGYSTHFVSYNTFMTKWREDYRKFTKLSPTRHKLVQIVKVLGKYHIIRQTKRGSNSPIYAVGINNPYHPDYKPTEVKEPEVGHRKTKSQVRSPSTPKRLQVQDGELDKEYENVLKSYDRKEDQ